MLTRLVRRIDNVFPTHLPRGRETKRRSRKLMKEPLPNISTSFRCRARWQIGDGEGDRCCWHATESLESARYLPVLNAALLAFLLSIRYHLTLCNNHVSLSHLLYSLDERFLSSIVVFFIIIFQEIVSEKRSNNLARLIRFTN